MLKDRIKEERNKKKVSQQKLAQSIGVSQQTIGSWETGRTEPDQLSIKKLCTYFDISPNSLLGIDTNQDSNISNIKELENIGDDSDIDDIYMYTLDVFNINTPYLRKAPLKDRMELLQSILEDFRPNEDNCELIFKQPKCFDNEIKINLLTTKLQNMIKSDNMSFKQFKQFIEFIDDFIDKMNESNKSE